MKEKRIHPRFGPLVVKVRFSSGTERRDGYLTNVSVGGAFLAVEDPPPLGADVDFVALLPWRLGELRGRAQVVWRSVGAREGESARRISGAGLAFHELDPEEKELLDSYLARFIELAALIEEMEIEE